MDYLGLFGQSRTGRPLAVASIRHGNVFDLANAAIIEVAGIIGRHSPLSVNPKTATALRETVVYVSLVTPADPASDLSRLSDSEWWASASLSVSKIVFAVGLAILVARRGLEIGPALLICIALSHVLTVALRLCVEPIFGNLTTAESDRVETARRDAALDIHVIAESWNSSKISIVCGYSSQLHALTNIPVRTSRPLFLKWLCRVLAVVLTTQAALLAATTNAQGNERWSTLLWLAVYSLSWLLKKGLHLLIGPERILEKQPANLQFMEPLHFSGRRAALIFISMLPVSPRANRWAWWDVFLPDNDRRRILQEELEGSPKFQAATRWKEQDGDLSNEGASGIKLSASSSDQLDEAIEVLTSPACKEKLKQYLDIVCPTGPSLSRTTVA
ncbi:hypothetical protein G647_05893 [Cladophialophora carrionii CBS 160.54]|uniref:Uncharacterized protein n=1 Tax=Cladophialophora carrionii CBS 160.54 TaxID=1279043 RepID=V9D4J0_9EURO|nr:uncharacterized protein G647_05893 [Cladophialophora carrionii CBS 160.54]ETI21824.1 hypothetical protein G647_05893 [Cladophialophora carrionii CBS 160.54]